MYYLCIDFVFQFIVEKYRNKLNQKIKSYYASWKAISPSKLVSNGYISNHNKR